MGYKNPEDYIAYHKDYNERRRKPKVKQAREIAKDAGETHYFTGIPCINGHLAKRRVNDRVCMECSRINSGKARKEKPEKLKVAKEIYYIKNKEKHLAQKKVYRKNNVGKIRALNASRKKVIKQRTPKWLTDHDKLHIKCIYQVAAMLTRENKEQWDVDHIIPLQGKLVSGLHVPMNLRPLKSTENISKKNKYEVNYAV